MTLTPEARVLLTDALRPPAGFRVDVAVGTTYSLNLTALLLAPLSFALFDQADSENIEAVDPIRLLEAVRRHAGRTTVFCEAGGIHVPSSYRSILTFVEDSILEVTAPSKGAIFHPKVWALRFVDQGLGKLHRFIILSRNMTLDRSWDTALVLDEADGGPISAEPAADFLRQLPHLALRPLTDSRMEDITDLANTLSEVGLAVPAPYTEGQLLPIGLNGESVWPFPEKVERLLAISPFLTKAALGALAGVASERTLISRPETLELVGADSLEGWSVNVLQRLAEIEAGEDVTEATKALTEFHGAGEGLHAKTYVMDLTANRSLTVTGSANLTSKPWGRGVEFDAALIGPTATCGVEAVLNGSAEAPGLSRLLEQYSVTGDTEVSEASISADYVLERFHQQLAVSLPSVEISTIDEDRVEARLSLETPSDPPGNSLVWPISLSGDVHKRPLDDRLTWTMAPGNITPFIAIETTAGEGETKVTRRCVLKASLHGDVLGRRHDAVTAVLRNKQDVLRYLIFLLGDPSYDALFAELAGADGEGQHSEVRHGLAPVDIALFEPLVRAAGRDGDALARVASLVEELHELPNGDELVPDGFDALWAVVWQVHQERLT